VSTDTEISITIRGGEVRAGGARIVESAGVPAPSAEMAGAGTVAAGVGEGVPSPMDALRTGEMGGTAPAPSPEMEGALVGAVAGTTLPAPVPLDQVEQLGSSAAAESGEDVAPEPEGGEG
jgi:hypothetical protein